MNICTNCKHVLRGKVVDRRKAEPGPPPPPTRLRTHICANQPIVHAPINPQNGYQDDPSGEACSVLNPTGECEDFAQSSYGPAFVVGISALIFIELIAFLALAT